MCGWHLQPALQSVQIKGSLRSYSLWGGARAATIPEASILFNLSLELSLKPMRG